jgi:hypothetical protein
MVDKQRVALGQVRQTLLIPHPGVDRLRRRQIRQERGRRGHRVGHADPGRLGACLPVTRPPKVIRQQLPRGYRARLPVLDTVLRGFATLTQFR